MILEKNKRKNRKKVPDKAIPGYRLKATSKVMVIIFALLTVRIAWIQFVQGSELKELASRQQTLNKIITPKRGYIYDTNGKQLAGSVLVDTISINPAKFVVDDKDEATAKYKTLELQEKVASGLSEIFSLDYDTVLAQVKSEKSTEVIAKQVENDLVEKLKEWMKENKVTAGINIDEDNKRFYPYGSLASHVIGFTGTDSNGLYGVEYKWDEQLSGTSR